MHHIWYHSPCNDGLGAAYAAWSALGESGMRYTPCAYGNPLPAIEPEDEVTLLDFTAPRKDLLKLAQVAGRITILDHHASAERALAGLTEEALATEGACELRVTFDKNHSGAILAWQHFHPGISSPLVLDLIEDRDLWSFEDPRSRPMHYALSTRRDFRDLHRCAESISELQGVVADGYAILQHLEAEWQSLAERAAFRKLPLPGQSVEVATAVSPCPSAWFSDLGHLLLEQHTEIQIAVLYADNPAQGHTTVSLRSRPGGPDVSVIAASLGGGGHPQAAGFRTTLGAIHQPWRVAT